MDEIKTKKCSKCKIIKPVSEFFVLNRAADKLNYQCKDCCGETRRRFLDENPGVYKSYNSNKPKSRKEFKLKYIHGISTDEYNIMFEEQKGRCAICDRPQSEFKRSLAVDHNHETGMIRGLLCNKCNLVLGVLEDNINFLNRAKAYLLANKQ